MADEVQVQEEPVEKIRIKKALSEKQLANLAAGRDKLRVKKVETAEEKANRKLEERFDKLVAMFDQVKLPAPEVQEKLKAKKVKAPPPPPEDSEDDSEDDEPPPPRKKAAVEKPRPVVQVQPTKQISFSFK